jgi:catechol 2,3-dioxygenase-like lactoylglutathione lyase family enzyme
MAQRIAQFAITVRDYDEALTFYVEKLGFDRLEDTDLGGDKRWVRVRPPGSTGAGILLARAVSDRQKASVGNQTGGRVFVFLETDDFWRDYKRLVVCPCRRPSLVVSGDRKMGVNSKTCGLRHS